MKLPSRALIRGTECGLKGAKKRSIRSGVKQQEELAKWSITSNSQRLDARVGKDRPKLWPMFGNLQEARGSLDISLLIGAKITPKAKGIHCSSHPSLRVFSELHKHGTGTWIPRCFSETRAGNMPRTNHEPSVVFQTDTQCVKSQPRCEPT